MRQEVKPWFFFKRTADKSAITLRLFMLPPAGGDVSTYLHWEEELPGDVELGLVRLPGRGARLAEPAFDRAEALTEVLADEIAAYTDLPYVLFGHSMGGLLAYELVQKLHQRGMRLPETVIISSMKAPCYMDKFTESLTADAGDKLYLKSNDDFINTIIGLGGIPEALIQNREFLQLILPTFRQDMKLCETYNPDDAQTVPVSFEIYGGNRDSIATREELEGWRAYTEGNFTLTLFQGGHFYFADHPQVVLFHLRNKLIDICRALLTSRAHS